VKWQIDEAQQQGRHLAAQLEEVRARLQEAYVEKSKFEQLIEQERLRAEADKAAREQAMLDEVAINRAGSTSK
jgi:flagellar export protein FliJ